MADRTLAALPADSLEAAVPHLRRPFTPEAVRWKIQTNPKSDTGSALIVCYIDARAAEERLNAVCPGSWAAEHRESPFPNSVICSLIVFGVVRENVGWFAGSDDGAGELAVKGVFSDAFKRAAVKFGVGVSLHAQSRGWVPAAESKQRSGKWYLPDEAVRKLRRG